jgi:RNA polymerase sigma-70 factor (ECF subfamily)
MTLTGGEVTEVSAALAREEAFRRLAERHLAASYRLAQAILHDASEAEDATHDAFVTAWRNWGSLRDPARFEPWFDRILVNTCRNRLRRTRRWQVKDISPTVSADRGDPAPAVNDRYAVGEALRRLDADHRVVIALRFYRDLSVDEIARRLAIRPGTVKSRLHYALRRLHADLDEAPAKEARR